MSHRIMFFRIWRENMSLLYSSFIPDILKLSLSAVYLLLFVNMTDTGLVVGIDLGTTYSEIYSYRNNQLEVIAGRNQLTITPSRVTVSKSSKQDNIMFLSGPRERMQNSKLPGNEIYEPKRIIGRKITDQYIVQDLYYYPFKIIPGPDDIPLYSVTGDGEDVTLSAIDVDAQILRTLASYGENIKKAVITVPAYFRKEQIDATEEAGRRAGLEVICCIPEPIAAAIAYVHAHKVKSQTVLVYDLGGGTFDCCIVRIENGTFKVLTSEGHSHLGGADFDNAIVQDIRDKIKAMDPAHDVFARSKDLKRLKRLAENAKIALSSSETFSIDFTTLDPLTDATFRYQAVFTRAEFNTLIGDDIKRTLGYIDRSLEQLGFTVNNIDQVVMIGGSTRIPLIQQELRRYFNREIDPTLVSLDEAVAQGAAIYAAEYVKNHDLLKGWEGPQSWGLHVTTQGDPIYKVPYNIYMNYGYGDTPVLHKDRPITRYVRVNRNVGLPYNNMSKFRLDIFKVDQEKECIGILELDIYDPVPRDENCFSVLFQIEEDGALAVSVTNKKDGTSEKLNLTCRGDHLDNQIERVLFQKRYEAEQLWKSVMDQLCEMENEDRVKDKRERMFDIASQFEDIRFEDEENANRLIKEIKEIERM